MSLRESRNALPMHTNGDKSRDSYRTSVIRLVLAAAHLHVYYVYTHWQLSPVESCLYGALAFIDLRAA